MKFLKNKLFLPIILACTIVYGCGGGGSGNNGGVPAVVTPPCTPIPLTSTSRLKISVKDNGIYVITPDILKSFCVDPAGASLQNFKLQNFDPSLKSFVDIPVSFDPQGNMEFYGVGVNRKDYTAPNAEYTDTNIFWFIPNPSTTIPQMSFKTTVSNNNTTAPMTLVHQEQNNIYWPDMLYSAGLDHWFWEVLPLTSPNFFGNQYQFTVNNYDSQYSSTPMNLTIAMESQVNVPHSVNALASPGFTGILSWSTTAPFIFTTSISASLTNGSPNIVQMGNNITADKIYFDWFELEYPGKALNDQLIFHGNVPSTNPYTLTVNGFSQSSIELFDISNPQIPKKFDSSIQVKRSGAGYQISFGDTLVPGSNNYIALTPAQRKTPLNIVPVTTTDLHFFPQLFDYLVITHGNFLTNVNTLANHRKSLLGGSHSVEVVTIDDVYDSYSGGIFTPQAIKDFLNYLYTNNKIMNPGYVLLVGDASFDYKNYLGFGIENIVPTVLIDYSYGQTPSDYWFVPNSAGAPLLALGRLPAKTGTEANTMINKIINYETIYKPTMTSNWNKNVIFISGQDGPGTFDVESNNLIFGSAFPSSKINLIRIYYSNFSSTSSFSTSIIGSINSGALITNYLGHGSVGVWANANSSQLSNYYLQSTDPYQFTNSTQLTFLVTLECLNGMFAGPNEGGAYPVSMSEAFLKSTGGAVAVFSPTGQGLTNFHSPLAQSLYNTIFATGSPPPLPGTLPQPVLGLAIRQAEKNLLLSPSASLQSLETVSIFVLLGDPATQLALPY